MKRFRWMAIIVAMLMVCAGCSEKEKQPTPTDVTKQFLTAIQKQDETALKTSSQWNLASMKSLQMQDEDYIDGIDHELQKAAHDTMYGFQFTIKKETIKDKNAQVAIILKTKDIRNAVKKGMKEAEKKVELESNDYTAIAAKILEGCGGKENITSIDNCVTRLRLEVKDITAVNDKVIKSAGVAGVIKPGKTSVQVIIGTKVQFVADEFTKLCE